MSSFDQDAVDATLKVVQPKLEAIERRLSALEARPNVVGLFAARDDFETALFSAMQGMTDEEQIEFFRAQAERLNA